MFASLYVIFDLSGQSRDRTGDLQIFSLSLYQLSYLSISRILGSLTHHVNGYQLGFKARRSRTNKPNVPIPKVSSVNGTSVAG